MTAHDQSACSKPLDVRQVRSGGDVQVLVGLLDDDVRFVRNSAALALRVVAMANEGSIAADISQHLGQALDREKVPWLRDKIRFAISGAQESTRVSGKSGNSEGGA